MGATPIVHRLTARNTATASPNKIHEPETARAYGFAGGLVPGVTVFAWMCGPGYDAYGASWLEAGTIEARFVRPVYDGEQVEVVGSAEGDGIDITVGIHGDVRATGRLARDGGTPLDAATFRRIPIPAEPPRASPETLAPGTVLGTVEARFEAARQREYLRSIHAEHRLTGDVAHPGWLLLLANLALSTNVVLGPWIHASSDMRLHAPATDGETVSAMSRVAGAFERKGHRFVELDVAIVASGRALASVRHMAIYEPRKPER